MESESFVTFVWRGDESTENVAIIDGVAVGVGDDDPARSLMTHLDGTDIWYRTYMIRNDASFHYWLSPNDDLKSLLADDRDSDARPDPLNPLRMSIGPSYVELADAPISPYTIDRDDVAKGTVEDRTFRSDIVDGERIISVYLPAGFEARQAGMELPLLVVFDRSSYLSLVPVPTILDNLIAEGRIPPTIGVFVGSLNRVVEYSASPEFTRFLAEELVPWARLEYGATDDPAQTVIGGSSAGGLAATFSAFQYPEIFGNVLAQSPSLHWSPSDSEEGWLVREFDRTEKLAIVFYLETGEMEASIQRRPINRMRDVLTEKGYSLRFSEFNGNHSYLGWSQTFADALVFLLAGD
jgi:enterochelin esterase family protein